MATDWAALARERAARALRPAEPPGQSPGPWTAEQARAFRDRLVGFDSWRRFAAMAREWNRLAAEDWAKRCRREGIKL